MEKTPRYENMDEKLNDIERYLILQVDQIRRLVLIAAALCAVCVATTLITLWAVNRADDAPGIPVQVSDAAAAEAPPTVERAVSEKQEDPQDEVADVSIAEVPAAKVPATAVSPPETSGWSFRVGRSAVATRIDSLEPVDPGDRFPTSVRRLYCWTRIETDDLGRVPVDDRVVTHRWIHEGEIVRERTVSIGSTSYRIFTKLDGPGERPGAWRVEIVDAGDRELGVVRFNVG